MPQGQKVGGANMSPQLCLPHPKASGMHPSHLFLVGNPFYSCAECAEPQTSQGHREELVITLSAG